MKNNPRLVSVIAALISTVGCGDTAWMRDFGPADASATGVPCSGATEFATASCGAYLSPSDPCVPGTAGLYCQNGFLVPDSCHLIRGYTCHPGASNPPPPVDAGTTQPAMICAPRSEVPSSLCDNGVCQAGVMGLTCASDGSGFIPGCHLVAGLQCRPVTTPPVDAGGTTPVDAGTTPVDTGVVTPPPAGMAGPGQIRVAINPEFYRWRRSSSDPNVIDRDASGNLLSWCQPSLLTVHIYNQMSVPEWSGTSVPLTTDRTVTANFAVKGGGERFDVRCGDTGSPYPYLEAWRTSGRTLRELGVTIASVGVAGLENQLDFGHVCRSEVGGNKGELAVQASALGHCVNP